MKKFDFEQHFFDNFKSYMVVITFFVIGIIAGIVVDLFIDNSQKQNMLKYVTSFLSAKNYNVSNIQLLKISLLSNFRTIIFIWLLGASVVGFPIVLFTMGYKGFSIGFCASFFIEKFKIKGFLFVLFTIFPQNIIIIPCMVIACVVAVKFSFGMLKNLNRDSMPIGEYSIFFICLFIVTSLGSLIDAYVTPLFLKLPFLNF